MQEVLIRYSELRLKALKNTSRSFNLVIHYYFKALLLLESTNFALLAYSSGGWQYKYFYSQK